MEEKTNIELQKKNYNLLYAILGNLDEMERRNIAEHISRPDFVSKPNKAMLLKISFLWDILLKFKTAKLQLIALGRIIFK